MSTYWRQIEWLPTVTCVGHEVGQIAVDGTLPMSPVYGHMKAWGWGEPLCAVSYRDKPENKLSSRKFECINMSDCACRREKGNKRGRSEKSIPAFTHPINLSQSDIWLSYVLMVPFCHWMTICLEKSLRSRARERLDAVWTLHEHQGKPNAWKVRKWNPQHLQQTHPGPSC